jgi:hypothetical protein
MTDNIYVVRDASGEYISGKYPGTRTPASNEALEFETREGRNLWEWTMLVREWWATYRLVLDHPADFSPANRRLNELTAECERRGIVRPGRPMPRDCAEDLAADVDDFKRRNSM